MNLLLKACKAFPSEFVDKAGERKKRKEREKEIRERGEAILRERSKRKWYKFENIKQKTNKERREVVQRV